MDWTIASRIARVGTTGSLTVSILWALINGKGSRIQSSIALLSKPLIPNQGDPRGREWIGYLPHYHVSEQGGNRRALHRNGPA